MKNMADEFIDWTEIKRRLAVVDAALEASRRADGEKRAALLAQRALRLAEALTEVSEEALLEVVEFSLGKEHYALENRLIQEVYPLREYTQLPCTPDFVAGLINVRGRIISIINLRRFLGIVDQGIGELNKVIILQDGEMEFGILADEIHGVKKIMRNEIISPLATMSGRRAEFSIGILRDGCVLIDAGRLLTDERVIVCEQP